MALSVGQREVRIDEAEVRIALNQWTSANGPMPTFGEGDKIVGARVTLPTMGDEVVFLVEHKDEEAKD